MRSDKVQLSLVCFKTVNGKQSKMEIEAELDPNDFVLKLNTSSQTIKDYMPIFLGRNYRLEIDSTIKKITINTSSETEES